MDVRVGPAPEFQKPLVRRLLELNAHDLSAVDGRELGPHGEYGYRYLDHYWIEPERRALLISVDGRIAGLALVRTGEPHQVAEFFILRTYRRRGVGRRAAQQVLRRFPGAWETHQIPGNDAAVAFWRRVIPTDVDETVDESGTTQRFHV